MQRYEIDWDEDKQEAILRIDDDSGWYWEGGTVTVFMFLYRAYRTAEFDSLKKALIDDQEKRAMLQIIMTGMSNNKEARHLLADAMSGGNTVWESDIDDIVFFAMNSELEDLVLNDYVISLTKTNIDRDFLWANELEILEILRNSYPVKVLPDEDRHALLRRFCDIAFKGVSFTDPLLFLNSIPDRESITETFKNILLKQNECTLSLSEYNKWIERASNEIKELIKTKGGGQDELYPPREFSKANGQGFN